MILSSYDCQILLGWIVGVFSEYLGVVLSTDIKPLADNAHSFKRPENNQTGNHKSLAGGRGQSNTTKF